jgi:hypothetical protein
LEQALHKTVRVREGDRVHNVPKIEAATDVILNEILKGNDRAFFKLLELLKKLGLADHPLPQLKGIKRILVYPKERTGVTPET